MAGNRDADDHRVSPMVSVLGHPALISGAGTREVGGMAGRLLVALCATGTAQPIDRLIEVLWADDPPKSARAALHVHLGTLRRVFANHPAGPEITRTMAGYRLRLGSWHVDADVARHAATDARSLLVDDCAKALAQVRRSLDLWRGPPYSVSGETVDVVAALRATALQQELQELEVEALLALGRHAEAELASITLVDAEPFREVRWAQLMRARYLGGRTGDALRTYQHARRALIDGLGIEPGALLRDLERSVLMGDASALSKTHGSAIPPPMAPPAPLSLIGRDEELHRCLVALAGGRTVIVHGPPGIGKSAFAAEAARRFAPSATAWIDPSSDLRTTKALSGGAELPSWLRDDVLALLVVDDADAMPETVARIRSTVRRSLPHLPILITSCVRPDDHEAVFAALEPLPVPEPGARGESLAAVATVRLLHAALADLAPAIRLTDDEVVLICRASGGLPLALRLAAGSTHSTPPDQIAAAVRSGLTATIATTLQLLDPDTGAAFRSLSVLRHAFDVDMAAAVAGVAPTDALRMLVSLVDSGLVQRRFAGRRPYSMLEPIRDLAEQTLRDTHEASLVWKRLTAWALENARSLGRDAASTEPPVADSPSAQLLPTFAAVIDHLADEGDSAQALLLARRLDAPLYLAGQWSQRRRLVERALSIPGPPSPDRAMVLALAARNGPLSTMQPARFDVAVASARAAGDEVALASTRHLRAISLWWRGDHAEALTEQRWAADVLEARGHPLSTEARKYEAVVLVQEGHHDEGLLTLSRIADQYERQGNPALAGHTLAYLGHCQRFVGDDDAAIADWRRALAMLLAAGNHASSIHVLLGLASVAMQRYEAEPSLALAAQAFVAIDRTSQHEYATWAWSLAIRALLAAGRLDEAVASARAGLAAAPKVTPGEVSRLAVELSLLAAALGSGRHTARLVGCAEAHTGPFELPLSSPAERERVHAAAAAADERFGAAAQAHVDAGRRCTVWEAAGELFD